MPEPLTREQQLEVNIESILDKVAIEIRPCKACGVKLWFVLTGYKDMPDGSAKAIYTPYTFDGTNHFIGCPKAKEFKRKAETKKDGPQQRTEQRHQPGVQGRLDGAL